MIESLQPQTLLPVQSPKTNYILIDFENVQPKDLSLLADHPVKILVFVGPSQTKLPFETVKTLQGFAERAEYIQVSQAGRNALDFHIAYYLGSLAKEHPQFFFNVISKDKGFDPLIEYLRKSLKLKAYRKESLREIPFLQICNAKTLSEKVESITHFLQSRGRARPRKETKLENAIRSVFKEELSASDLQKIISELKKRKLITIDANRIAYYPPITETPPN